MSPSVGTSSDLIHHLAHTSRVEHVPAACERVSACRDDCGPARGTDCFERGPVPFADFLYRENRRLELEHPRMLPDRVGEPAMDDAKTADTMPGSTVSSTATRSAEIGAESGDRKIVRQGAIVMNFSRPTLVAKFIDLYA